jgi:hypothetical protein
VCLDLDAAATTLHAKSALPLFALAAGRLDPAAALRDSEIVADGDVAALDDFPELFDMAPDDSEPHNPQGA